MSKVKAMSPNDALPRYLVLGCFFGMLVWTFWLMAQ